jgi:hypothetical protein
MDGEVSSLLHTTVKAGDIRSVSVAFGAWYSMTTPLSSVALHHGTSNTRCSVRTSGRQTTNRPAVWLVRPGNQLRRASRMAIAPGRKIALWRVPVDDAAPGARRSETHRNRRGRSTIREFCIVASSCGDLR